MRQVGKEGKRMINSKGEQIYTNAEIAYELGISPSTVNAVGRRLFGGGRIAHWTLNDAKPICEYIKSISVEEDSISNSYPFPSYKYSSCFLK